MEKLITFGSMTNAMKAKELLRRHRIPATLIRTPAKLRRGSCGYSLVIPKRFSEAAEMVERSGIPYRGIYADGAQ